MIKTFKPEGMYAKGIIRSLADEYSKFRNLSENTRVDQKTISFIKKTLLRCRDDKFMVGLYYLEEHSLEFIHSFRVNGLGLVNIIFAYLNAVLTQRNGPKNLLDEASEIKNRLDNTLLTFSGERPVAKYKYIADPSEIKFTLKLLNDFQKSSAKFFRRTNRENLVFVRAMFFLFFLTPFALPSKEKIKELELARV